MTLLAIECSSKIASVALSYEGKIYERTSNFPKTHSEFINSAVSSLLKDLAISIEQIEAFGCGIGPGSFTGLRVAVGVCKTFSYIQNKPIYCLDSLDNLFLSNIKDYPSLPRLCLINAYKNMVFSKLYLSSSIPKSSSSAESLTFEQVDELLSQAGGNQYLTIGDGFAQNESQWASNRLFFRPTGTIDYPSASIIITAVMEKNPSIQTLDWKLVNPLYIRPSAAEESFVRST